MKTRIFIFALSIIFALPLVARIGDRKQEIADRLFAKTQHAYVYPSKQDRLREALELPYKKKMFMFPADTENFFLYKNPHSGTSAQGDTITQHELYGWELHLVFYKGKSVMEFYRRHGDTMTSEELEELMKTVITNKLAAKWQYVEETKVTQIWDFDLKNSKITNKTMASGKTLKDILPESPHKYIYIEIPENVLNDGFYKTTLTYDMYVVESRKANERYRNYVAKQEKQRSAKTSKNKKVRQSAPPRINVFAEKAFKTISHTFYNPQAEKFSIINFETSEPIIGGSPLVCNDKTVQMVTYLPKQDDTAFGYTYETSDKSVRALLYKNAVLFIDTAFDKQLREYMDNLYKKQSDQRARQAKDSVSHF